jgi:hypothetical protein
MNTVHLCSKVHLVGVSQKIRPKKMIASRRSMKMRVVCTLGFVLGMDIIYGGTEVGSLGGLTDLST